MRPALTPNHYRARRHLALGFLAAAQFLVVLDASIVNIAMPTIGQDMDVGQGVLTWVVTSYVLAFGGLLMLGGRLGDRYGHRKMFMLGVAGFMLASVMAALSPAIPVLLVARALQGVSAALLAPAALAVLMKLFPAGDGRTQAISVWGGVAGIGGVTGAILGGFLTTTFGWTAIFYINVPICLAVLAAVPLLVAPDVDLHPGPLDIKGAATITAAMVLLVAGFTFVLEIGLTAWPTLASVALGLGLMAVFGWIEQASDHPLVPLSIFRHRSVTIANVVMLVVGGVTLAFFYILSLQMQLVYGLSALATGAMQLPLTIALLVTTTAMPSINARLGARLAQPMAMGIMACGFAWLSLAVPDGNLLLSVVGPMVLIGIGLGGAFTSTTELAVEGISPDKSGLVSGLINTSQQIGGALGLAIAVTLATSLTAALRLESMDERLALHAGYGAAYACLAAFCLCAALLAFVSAQRARRGAVSI